MTPGIHQQPLRSSALRNQKQMNGSVLRLRHTGGTNRGGVQMTVDAKKAIMRWSMSVQRVGALMSFAAMRLKNVWCVLEDLKLAAPEYDSSSFRVFCLRPILFAQVWLISGVFTGQ